MHRQVTPPPTAMSRTAKSTSAYDAFPAQEFDAWIDKLRHTIIDGLEEPEVEVPPLAIPQLSEQALEAVRQAEIEAAEAAAEAQAREDQARAAAVQQLEKRRQELLLRQAQEQQLEEEQQEYTRQARARQEREAQRLEYYRQQSSEEERERLRADENATPPNEAQDTEDAEFMEGDEILQNGQNIHDTDSTEWTREQQGVIDDSDDDVTEIQPLPGAEYDYENDENAEVTPEKDVFEYSDDDIKQSSQGSQRSQDQFDPSDPAEEQEEAYEDEYEEGSQSEGEAFLETASRDAARPQTFRSIHSQQEAHDAETSESEQGASQYDEVEDLEQQNRNRDNSPSAPEESEEGDRASDEEEVETFDDTPQVASFPPKLHDAIGSEGDVIEVDDNSSEGESDNEARSWRSESGSQARQGVDGVSTGAVSDEREGESNGEISARAVTDESGAESEGENEAEPFAEDIRPRHRPSEYDLDDDEAGSGVEYGGSGSEDELGAASSQYSHSVPGVEGAEAADHLQQSSEDELDEDDDDNRSVAGDVEQSEYWRPSRAAQVIPEEHALADIDPALTANDDILEQNMVQVSSRGLAIESLVQMAYSSAPLSQDDLALDINSYINRPDSSAEPLTTEYAGDVAGITSQNELLGSTEFAEAPQLNLQATEAEPAKNGHQSVPLEPEVPSADSATWEATSAQDDMTSDVPRVYPALPTASPGAGQEDGVVADAARHSPTFMALTSETGPEPAEQPHETEHPQISDRQDSILVDDEQERQHRVLVQEENSDNRDIEMISGHGVSIMENANGSPADQRRVATESGEDSNELDDDDRTTSESVAGGQSDRDEGLSDIPLPEPDGYPHHRHDEHPSPSAFDRDADFVRLRTPSTDEDDELEDGEIRDDDDEAPQQFSDEGVHAAGLASARNASAEQVGEPNTEEDRVVAGVSVKLDLEVDLQLGVVADRNANMREEPDESSLGNLPDTENSDGIRRGGADIMGSRLDGVRVDEIFTLEEDDKDSQQDPEYSADESDSAEDIQYGSDDVAPLPLVPEPDVDEVDPEDRKGLSDEIRSHDRNDIPHKNEHLIEEDEEYNDDEPEHHVDGRPSGYDGYEVVDETDPRDLEVFDVAERDHSGVGANRTTEQVMIQEMDLRQQPGDAVRAAEGISAAQNAKSMTEDQDVMPTQPSVDDVHLPGNQINDATSDRDSGTVQPVVKVPDSESQKTMEPESSEALPTTANEGSMEVEEDIFAVDPSLHIEASARHDAIVDMLHSDELPPAPEDHRSPSPLAPEAELQHDVALVLEPAPLLHRRDQHHNVVLEESHRLHKEKLLSFTSAIDAVEESTQSVPSHDHRSQHAALAGNSEADVRKVDQSVRASPLNETSELQPGLPTPPRIESTQDPSSLDPETHDDGDDPLLLSGRFDDSESITSPNPLRAEVYVDVPPLDRSLLPETGLDSEVEIEILQRVEPTTPLLSATSSTDPTRHHHGPVHRTSYSSIRSEDNDISGSPAAHTRSQCHYHKIRFGRGVFSHVLLIPHCSIGNEVSREKVGARDMGRVTKEEMLHKRDLNLGDTFTHKMTSDVVTLPDNLEHLVRQLVGADLLREGHIWLLPLADVAPQSVISRSLEGADSLGDDDVFHVRRGLSQTPERKRKRGSSRARSTSSARSDVESPESVCKGTRSKSRAGVVRKVSQIDEKEEEAPEMMAYDVTKQSSNMAEESPGGASMPFQHQGGDTIMGEVKQDAIGEEDLTDKRSDGDGEQIRSEKRSSDEHEEEEEQCADGHANKKRIVERADGQGRDAIEVRPVQKTGWLSWLFGKRS